MKRHPSSSGSLGLALSAAALLALVGCERKGGDPVPIGALTTAAEVQKAINDSIAGVDASTTQVGAFAHWQETETIAAAVVVVSSDVGLRINERDDQSDLQYVLFDALERKIEYAANGAARTTDTARELAATKPVVLAPIARPVSTDTSFLKTRQPRTYSLPFSGVGAMSTGEPVKMTYHSLVKTSARVPPPEAVRLRPNCGGVKGCTITLNDIQFDQLFWNNPVQPDKMHVRIQTSPDVPFLAALMNRCVTALVPIGNSKTLYSQCSPIVDFHF